MPKIVCQGWPAIQPSSVRQLATRPESTPSVAENRYSAVAERRSQYMSANAGKTCHVTTTAIPAATASGIIRRRRRLSHISTATATARLIREAREYESTSAAKKTAPPAASALRGTGDSSRGREKPTAIMTRKNAQKLPSVLA